ncbi:MAG: EAL domain-containing protein [Pseudomonadota bacterium]
MEFLSKASGGPGAIIRAAFVLACILATSAAMGLVLGQVLGTSPALAGGLVLLALLVCALGLWALQMSKAMETMRAHALALANFETSLADRLEAMNADATAREKRIDALQNHVSALEQNIADLRSRPEPASTSPIAPVATPSVLTKVEEPEQTTSAVEATQPQIRSALRRDALSLHLQPVVTLPDRQPKHFLVSMRMQDEDGAWLDDETFNHLTRTGRLLPQIERKMLFAAVRIQRRLGSMKKRTSLICPLSEQTLANKRAFEPVLQFAQANTSLGPSVAFATTARDQARLSAAARGRLGDLVDAGFGLARTDIADLGGDIEVIAGSGVRMLAVDQALLIRARADDALGIGDPTTFATRLRNAGIDLVVTGVDDETALAALFDYDVTLAVGELFAPPRPVRMELEGE